MFTACVRGHDPGNGEGLHLLYVAPQNNTLVNLNEYLEGLLLREAQYVQQLAVFLLHHNFKVLLGAHTAHVAPTLESLRLPLDGRTRGGPHRGERMGLATAKTYYEMELKSPLLGYWMPEI